MGRRRKLSFADDYQECGQTAIAIEEFLQELTANVTKELHDFARKSLELFDNETATQNNDLDAANEEADELREAVEILEARVEELEETVRELEAKLAARKGK
jgi:ubiquinone biosynthesis protein UbiJ